MWTVGSLAMYQAAYGDARAMFEASLQIRCSRAEPAALLGPLSGLGAVAMQQGNLALAETYFEEALKIQKALEDRLGMAESLNSLANVAHERGDLRAHDCSTSAHSRYSPPAPPIVRTSCCKPRRRLSGDRRPRGREATFRGERWPETSARRYVGAGAVAREARRSGGVPRRSRQRTRVSVGEREAPPRHRRSIGHRVRTRAVRRRRAHPEPGDAGVAPGAVADALRRTVGAPLTGSASSRLEETVRQAREGLSPGVAMPRGVRVSSYRWSKRSRKR